MSWLESVVAAALPYSTGGGVIACTIEHPARGGVAPSQLVLGGGATDDHATAIRRFCKALPAHIASALFAPTEFVGNAAWRIERIAKEKKLTAGSRAMASLPSMWAIVGGAPAEQTITIMFPAPPENDVKSDEPFPRKDSRILGLVAAHLGAALRLRALSGGAGSVSVNVNDATTDGVDAILSPNGRILHATGEARDSSKMRTSLSEAVLRSEQARGKLRRVDAGEATKLWSALVEGRWSLVDASERDGKRLLLARRNTMSSPDLLELTKEENDVVWLAVHGHSHKYIAYELGVSVAAVGRRLRNALRKLRIDSRRDLVRLLSAPNRTPL